MRRTANPITPASLWIVEAFMGNSLIELLRLSLWIECQVDRRTKLYERPG
jgi:hypothetical protein